MDLPGETTEERLQRRRHGFTGRDYGREATAPPGSTRRRSARSVIAARAGGDIAARYCVLLSLRDFDQLPGLGIEKGMIGLGVRTPLTSSNVHRARRHVRCESWTMLVSLDRLRWAFGEAGRRRNGV